MDSADICVIYVGGGIRGVSYTICVPTGESFTRTLLKGGAPEGAVPRGELSRESPDGGVYIQ